ncbi:MAG: hypothetical protein OHK0023_07460 [Anaerolineae bacterium]
MVKKATSAPAKQTAITAPLKTANPAAPAKGGRAAGASEAAKPTPGTAKKPRGATERAKAAAPRKPAVAFDVIAPRRNVGPQIKLVERVKRAPDAPPSLIRRALQNPHQIHEAFQARPVWIDDLGALLLITIGTISFLTLLNSVPTAVISSLSDQWADWLSQLFGRVGALTFSALLVIAGVVIVLPRAGVKVYLTWRRILAVEAAFVAGVALLHLLSSDPEPRALARSGNGGGYVGWAVGEILAKLLGTWLASLTYGVILVVAVGVFFGVQRKQVRQAGLALSKQLEQLSKRLKSTADPNAPKPAAQRRRLAQLLGVPIDEQGNPLPPEQIMPHTAPLKAARPTAYPPAQTVFAPPSESLAQTMPQASVEPAAQATRPTSIPPLGVVASQDTEATVPLQAPAKAPSSRSKRSTKTAPTVPMPTASTEDETAILPPPISTPMPTYSTPLRSATPIAPISAELPTEVAEPDQAQLPALAPVAAKIGASVVPPAPPPERKRRYFTVDDFTELRAPFPREGLPPLTLLRDTDLAKPTEQEINSNARIIEDTLLDFDIDVEVVDVKVGPTVTQYAVQPFREVQTASGEMVVSRVRVNKIAALSNDLAMALSAKRLRVQPFVPGFSYMGIEVPNRHPSIVALRPVMESEVFVRAFRRADSDAPDGIRELPLVVPLGRDVSGEPVVVDLAQMPHLLIAGTTGSGKSVCITAMITALVLNNPPDRLKLILLDPKMVELNRFNGLPHLLGPVETDIERIIGVLRWATREMDRRYKLLEQEAARNIEVFNRNLGEARRAERLPYIAIIVDEIGDLMLSRPEEVERTLTRLAQMARAVGIHMVIATQRPSTDIITGLIKANFPSRISFMVASGVDSRVILDTTGAESLIGRGDMLYAAPDAPAPRRVQGCFVSDDEIEAVMNYWRTWAYERGVSHTEIEEFAPWDRGMTRREALGKSDPILEEAIAFAVKRGEASASILQRGLGIDYQRAARLMDLLNDLGILGVLKTDGRTREVTLKPGTDKYKSLLDRARAKK